MAEGMMRSRSDTSALPPFGAWICAVGAIFAMLGVLCLSYARWEVIDDAYISFRYACNLAAGHGLVFNVGERVEGYTNFLWVVILAGPAAAGIDLPLASKIFGALCAFLTLWATFSLLPPPPPLRSWRRLLAPALLASNAAVAMWAVHGLETLLFTLLVTVAIRADCRAQAGGGRPFSAGLWFALATLTRPEGAVLFAVGLVYQLLTGARGWLVRRGWLSLVVYAAIVLPHLAWRLYYYGYPLPNTFYAKAGFSWSLIVAGAGYVAAFALDPRNAGALLLLAPAALRARREPTLRYLFCMLGACLGSVIVEGGDFFPGFRFLVPAFPILYVLVQEGVVAGLEWLRDRPLLRLTAAIAAVLLLWLPHAIRMRAVAGDETRGTQAFTTKVKLVGRALKERFPPGTVIAANPVGALPYYSGFHTYDLLGFTDRHIAHTPIQDIGSGIIGHERGDGAYVFRRKPDLFLLGNVYVTPEPPSRVMGRHWPGWLRSEVEFLNQPDLWIWYEKDVLPLPDGQFLYFLRRKGFP